ncbi:MAG: valine--tRNA ligase, partial [Candidatus Zixiibacteriota bacterium]
MPPPNANAPLHVGHAMFVTIEDILTRYQRMKGKSSLWLPGADHAGILTQVVFERHLAKKGKTRYDLGRKKFYQQCFEFTQENKERMFAQIKALGASCDWSREKFTLDPEISKQVLETFVRLYQDGLIYRGRRLVNWCPRCTTALSDLEVIHQEQKDPLYFVKYPLKKGGELTVATTRPETMFGDTALAVNSKDKRWKKFVGRTALLPIIHREIPIIADSRVDPEFGTGVVKITPAHDPQDFEIGKRHQLEVRRVIDFDLKLNEKAGPYQGLDIFKAREKLAQDLKNKGLLLKVDKTYLHSVGICERCQTQIEPLVSQQWFIKTKPLAKKAIKAVKEGKIKILPKRFEKNYFQWMENIRDWCVSRQIWWGHRMPVYYCGTKGLSNLQKKLNPELSSRSDLLEVGPEPDNGCGHIIVSVNKPKKCPKCGGTNIIQDPDTLDTWFSSAQWPFTSLGFQWKSKSRGRRSTVDGRQLKISDFQYFYPTSVMETGYEILFFWVARMIILGIYATGKVPFKTVYLHGLVRDALGEKMSKSKGNVIDPLEVAQKYGADALRFSLVWGTAPGNDLNLGEQRIKGMRNFSNKIWNIGRFIETRN